MRLHSLKARFLLKVSMALGLILAVVAPGAYWLFRAELLEATRERGEALAVFIRDRAQVASDGLAYIGPDLARLLEAHLGLTAARLVKQDGTIVASYRSAEVGQPLPNSPDALPKTGSMVFESGDATSVFVALPVSGLLAQFDFDARPVKKKASRAALLTLFIGTGAFAIIALLLLYWVREAVENPLDILADHAGRAAAGDLTISFGPTETLAAEMADIAGALNRMTAGLRGIVARIENLHEKAAQRVQDLEQENQSLLQDLHDQNNALRQSIQGLENINRNTSEINARAEDLYVISDETSSSILQIKGAIEEVETHVTRLSGAVGQTSSSIVEIGRSIKEVAARAQELAQNTDEMKQAIQEISATITAVEKNAQQSADLSKEVSESAKVGLESVERNGESMARIRTSVEETSLVIRDLSKRSQEIGEIVTVINQVTEKTNLLALNAAIIAAAAGEHGASFAVVADGIRDLARQVAAKTREIEALVQGVQKETKKAEEKAGLGLATVVEGEQLAQAAREKLRMIYEKSRSSEEMSTHISHAMAEQNRSSKAISEASTRLAAISHQIAQATQQEAAASSQIERSVAQMEELANSVLRTTREQAEAGRHVSEAMARINTAIHAISEITGRHKAETEAVLQAVHGNQTRLGQSEERLRALARHITAVDEAVRELETAITEIKVA